MLRTLGLKPLIFRSKLITETIEISFGCVTSVSNEFVPKLELSIYFVASDRGLNTWRGNLAIRILG
jgi:hypothetical protein